MGSTGSPVVTESIELQDLLFIPAVLVSFFSNIVMLIDLYTIEKGLVYGPPSSAKKIALTECCGDKLKKCCADKLKKACGEYDQEQANKEDNQDGKILIESTKYDEKILYRDAKYFNNVSIYFSHSDLDYFNSDDIHFSHRNLLPLISLNSLRKRNKTQVVRVAIEKVVNKSRLQLDDGRKHECFIINHQPDGRSVRKEQCSENFIVNLHKEFIFQIKYVISKDRLLLKPKQVFGDIHYNMKVKTRTECTQPDFRVSDNLKDRSSDSTTAVLHYFRSADGVDEDYNVRYIREEQKTFYQAQDLEDSVDIWNTGILHCKSSGNLAPTFDKEILVNC
ncbi:hypothetical protein MAR_010825 [Mya arenaria]|uniref:Uncharacterized protein n=1 Tax=Mya arenaria TaxID=6604 RepID=A0ABY7G193_MYAAR|nr:hypothetical protein MAR_010825 [Mya arenaria]